MSLLSASDSSSEDISIENAKRIGFRITAVLPTIVASHHRLRNGKEPIDPNDKLTHAENFLYMTFSVPSEDFKISHKIVKAMDRFFMLHADHEQNASTSTVRLAGSSGANPFACIAAGIASLWGPAHGGANEAVIKMLEEIGDVANIQKLLFFRAIVHFLFSEQCGTFPG